MKWEIILSLVLGALTCVIVLAFGMKGRWYEIQTGRVGKQPIIEYRFEFVIAAAILAGVSVWFLTKYLLGLPVSVP
jgi:hypothetical protein